ncbi:MAG TPA: MFS transporter [Steroidobacteraceae bacterium]|nr:MFS transporter [Steroidobacteraceae bacterium]
MSEVQATVGRPRVAASYPNVSYASYVVAVLFAATLLSQLDRQLPALLVRPLKQEFGISDTAFSLLQGYGFAIFYTLAGLPLGRLVDKGSRRNLIIAGLLFWSIATALFAFAQSYTHLMLARVGVGIGEAVLAPAAYSLIADYIEPGRRGRALAAYYVSLAIGSGASLLLGGWLLKVIPHAGVQIAGLGVLSSWRAAFLFAAVPGLPLALLLALSLREPKRHELNQAASVTAPSIGEFMRFLRQHSATFWRVLTYPTLLSIIGYGTLAWAPAQFDRRFGIPPSRSGVVIGIVVATAGAIGTLLSGFLSDYFCRLRVSAARLRVAFIGVLLLPAPAVFWPLSGTPGLAYALLFVTVFSLSIAQSAAPALIQGVVPNRMRGLAIATYLLLAGLLGIGLGPTLAALLTDYVFKDSSALRYSLAICAAPTALLALWLIGSGLKPYEASIVALRANATGDEKC